MKNLFKFFAAPQKMETTAMQTDQVNEFVSFRAQKTGPGRYDIYTRSYYPVQLDQRQYLGANDKVVTGTFTVEFGGEKIQCWAAEAVKPARTSQTRADVDAYFAAIDKIHAMPLDEKVTAERALTVPVWKK